MKNWIFKEESSLPPDPKVARTRAILLALPFALLGIGALVMLLHDELGGGLPRQRAIGTASFIVTCFGFVALILGINAKKMALQASGLKSSTPATPEKPWLQRPDWAAGRVASGSRKSVILLWLFVLIWCGFSGAFTLALVPQAVRHGNHAALIALIFPLVGLGVLAYAINTTLAWRKFGQSIFEMAAVPAAPGGTLEGEIQVPTKLQPLHGLHLRLSCLRRTTTGAGKNRQTTEKILWEDEKWLKPDLPQTGVNATGIPVYFKLPEGQPESTPARGDGIHWRLEASAKLRGPGFHASFDVPVFKLAEPPEVSEDPTAKYQMSLDEIRQQIHSKIQIADLAGGGKELVFPAARNRGFASGAAIVCLVWTGIVALLLWKHAPPLLPIIFGVIDLALLAVSFDLWFRRSRVSIAAGEIKIETAWLVFKRQASLKISDAANFLAELGATAGHSAYLDLKLRMRDGREFTLAKHLSAKPEADWLVREMTAAAKRSATTETIA
ncbi:MAG: hypothetical protein ABSE16_07540 [Verrucomicrobiota bacterium]|jgi:hypothetical protein